jgi:DNA polymerase III subunit delta'
MNFNGIIGQKELISSLVHLVTSDKVGHAYIFTGPAGIGKRTLTEAFASLLLCAGRESESRCGKCMPCQLYESSSNPDYKVIQTDNASISIEEIRGIQSDIIVRPVYSPKKVYLIMDADKMTVQAQNCLLKTLEEPPGYAVILLTASHCDALLETILSRVSRYSLKKNTPQEVCQALEREYGSHLQGMDFVVSYADGVIGTALQLAGSEEFAVLREKILDILIKLPRNKLLYIFEAYDFFEAGKDQVSDILNMMLTFYRDLLLAKRSRNEKILINSDKKDIILNNVSHFSVQKLMKNIETVEETHKMIRQNANFQLAIEVMLMKLQEEDTSW